MQSENPNHLDYRKILIWTGSIFATICISVFGWSMLTLWEMNGMLSTVRADLGTLKDDVKGIRDQVAKSEQKEVKPCPCVSDASYIQTNHPGK